MTEMQCCSCGSTNMIAEEIVSFWLCKDCGAECMWSMKEEED